jgi:hypothetical protein
MDTDKLLKAIQILVESEVKRQIPIILSEISKTNKKKAIVETSKVKHRNSNVRNHSLSEMLKDDDVVDDTIQYTKNPVLNQILNETRQNGSNYPGSSTDGYAEYPTMNPTIQTVTQMPDVNSFRTQMADKMGYGDMISVGGGLGVKTGNDVMDKILNRDYTELVKRF